MKRSIQNAKKKHSAGRHAGRQTLAAALSAALVITLSGGDIAAATTTESGTSDASVSAVSVSSATEGSSGETGKDETVYVVADANGNPEQIIVNDWLKNGSGSATIDDVTNLTDIENTKGDETYTDNGDGSITWQADGSDIYYRGNSDRELPVTTSVTYELDGEEIDPDELAGKSGHLAITFHYTNNTAKSVTVSGERTTIYRPYLVISGLYLDNDSSSNITVTNGRAVNDGDRTFVVGAAAPGLAESLNLEDIEDVDVTIPEEVTVEADVTDFELAATLTVISGNALEELDLDSADSSMDSLLSDADTLSDSAQQLADGATDLNTGIGELKTGTDELASGAEELADGADQLQTGADSLAAGISTLQSGVAGLPDSAAQLLAGAEKLSSALKSGDTSDVSNYGVYEALQAIATGADGVAQAAQQIMDGAETIAAGAKSGDTSDTSKYGIYEAADALETGLTSQMGTLQSGLTSAVTALQTGSGYAQAAYSGLESLQNDTGVQTLKASLPTLLSSAETLETNLAGYEEGYTDENLSAIQNGLTSSVQLMEAAAAEYDALAAAATDATEKAQYEAMAANLRSAESSVTAANSYITTSDALIDGAYQYVSGSVTALEGTQSLVSAVTDEDGAVSQIMQGVDGAKQTMDGVANALGSVSLDTSEAVSTLEAIKTGAEAISTGAKSGCSLDDVDSYGIYEAAQAIRTGALELKSAAVTAASGIDTMTDSENLGAMIDGLSQLASESGTLVSGVSQLSSGATQLSSGLDTLTSGADTLSSGADELADGVSQVADGSQQLLDGILAFNEEGIDRIVDLIQNDVNGSYERLQALQDYAEETETYSGVADGVSCSVKYVIKTDEISLEE